MLTIGVLLPLLAIAAAGYVDVNPNLEEYGDMTMHPKYSYTQPRIDFKVSPEEQDPGYWYTKARKQLHSALNRKPIETQAKSAIMFLGDGMSIPTITAARMYGGQLNGESGEESTIFFEEYPYIGLSKTYSISKQVADSAATATAYLGGVKTNSGMLGLTASVTRGDCMASLNESYHVPSIIKWAQDAGMSTGIVTTTRVTHASPGGSYAHVAERDWENDADVAEDKVDPKICKDIAQQLIYGETGRKINVIMGGGRRNFLPKDVVDEEGKKGKRLDGKNLIADWQSQKTKRGLQSSYVWNRDGLMAVDTKSTDYLLGLFESSHMMYHLESNPATEPTLEEMTDVAIKILSKNPKGYFLFVEGGRIDHAHHGGKAHLALDETVQMATAVKHASNVTSEKDTLIVVTADHAHTMSISGYPQRGNPIFATSGVSEQDGLPYTTLSYANGPGYKPATSTGGRYDVSYDDLENPTYRFPAIAPLSSETHGGDDVAVYARGPWAHIFSGNYEQNFIMHAMCYAMGIGPASGWPSRN